MRSKIVALFVGLVLFAGASQASASLIANGGFETGDFTGWTTDPTPSFPQTIVTSPVNSGNFAAQIAGFQFDPDTLTQIIATDLGQTYELSFARFQAGGPPPIGLEVTWNGATVFSEVDTGFQPYQTFSVSVVGTGSDELVFISYNDPSFTYLDDVSLVAVDAVPEPASLVLWGLGALGCAVAGYRRRKSA